MTTHRITIGLDVDDVAGMAMLRDWSHELRLTDPELLRRLGIVAVELEIVPAEEAPNGE